MKLNDPKTQKEYLVRGPLYENAVTGVWCGSFCDPDWGECFVKVQNYGQFEQWETRKSMLEIAREEANTIRCVSQCSEAVPKLYAHWEDKPGKRYVTIMKKMPGVSLRQWMEKRPVGELTSKDVFVRSMIVKQLCEIMQRIHGKYPVIVHRDLKPENIYISLDEKKRWKVSIVDFGCANMNYVRNVGTAAYQAPEQIGVKGCAVRISPRTDVFAIGQIYYELLLGRVPIVGTDYRFRAGTNAWTERPGIPEALLELPGMKEVDELLKGMTLFRADERLIYNKIVMELTKIFRMRK